MLAPGAASADSSPSLATLAAASDRPAECAALSGRAGKKPSIWRLSRKPMLGAYCDEIARAQTLVESDPRGALASAKKADDILTGHASTFTAIGRANLVLGDIDASIAAFENAKKLDARALDEPKAMNDFARALVLAKRPADAAPIYKALVPRASLLPDKDRSTVLLRAAHALMAHAASKPDDASADFADAIAYLAEARSSHEAGSLGEILVSTALVLDRSGDSEKATAALQEAERAGASITKGGEAYIANPSDKLALEALLLEVDDPPKAAAAWQKFLESSPDPVFAKAAKSRLAGSKGKPPKKVP
jgi:tetratricopeptide (TPR) repeat protein